MKLKRSDAYRPIRHPQFLKKVFDPLPPLENLQFYYECSRPEFRKFVEIKIIKYNQYSKIVWSFLHDFGQKYKNNWKFSQTKWFGRGGEASEILWFFTNFSSCHFNFYQTFAGRPPKTKANNSVLLSIWKFGRRSRNRIISMSL